MGAADLALLVSPCEQLPVWSVGAAAVPGPAGCLGLVAPGWRDASVVYLWGALAVAGSVCVTWLRTKYGWLVIVRWPG